MQVKAELPLRPAQVVSLESVSQECALSVSMGQQRDLRQRAWAAERRPLFLSAHWTRSDLGITPVQKEDAVICSQDCSAGRRKAGSPALVRASHLRWSRAPPQYSSETAIS